VAPCFSTRNCSFCTAILDAFALVIALLSLDTGLPLPVSHLHDGTSVEVFQVPKAQIPLSSSVKDRQAYPELEQIIGIELSRYALA
jgi:uncharacterized protein